MAGEYDERDPRRPHTRRGRASRPGLFDLPRLTSASTDRAGSHRRFGRGGVRLVLGRQGRRLLFFGQLVGACCDLLARLDIEEIADALKRPDSAGLARLGAQLTANTRYPDPQVLEIVAIFGPPDLCQ